ncbi:hypothetical protein [Candidatus Binatus sp.]|uniref:hypothetical protein n=1 Tax=Candidatus Binatus sp. TaxID=2811406 RepID=UPI00272D4CAB|nr:hypothetical protein [Candidatus Binatus sp.]
MAIYDGELKRKKIGAEEAAAKVRSGDWVEYGFGLGQPNAFDRALAERVAHLERIKIRGCLAMRSCADIDRASGFSRRARAPGARVQSSIARDFLSVEKILDRKNCGDFSRRIRAPKSAR